MKRLVVMFVGVSDAWHHLSCRCCGISDIGSHGNCSNRYDDDYQGAYWSCAWHLCRFNNEILRRGEWCW